eukprot:SAG31_NODE_32958_length_349_cov_1.476000_1_plen_29_part_01
MRKSGSSSSSPKMTKEMTTARQMIDEEKM